VRRAKLYYLRERSGKSARIREKLDAREKEIIQDIPQAETPKAVAPEAAPDKAAE
jgi:large subunit ribosomal protein L19